VFRDRVDAGRQLAERLGYLAGDDVVVLGLPRGGVPVAFEVARALGAPLDVVVVRKLGIPFQPELAMGAIGEDGVRVLNDDVLRAAMIGAADFAAVERRERAELDRRAERFRRARPRLSITGRTAVIVDDGIATGSTVRAACQVARAHGAARIVVAAPVGPSSAPADLADVTDEIVCLTTPEPFDAVGRSYWDFSPTTDDEVVSLLERSAAAAAAATSDRSRHSPPAPLT
jgi:putative phosphoribosyl transferase